MFTLLSSIVLPIVFVFCLAYAIKFLLADETIYFVICAGLSSASLIFLLYWLVDHML